MQSAMTMTTVALTLLLAQVKPEPSKPFPADAGPGRIAWLDLTTPNLPRSKEFYGKLFDWTSNPVPGSDQALEIVARGAAIGTLRVAEGEISSFNGVVYVQVDDIQASCAKAKEPGGTGAIGLVLDPAGHPFGMYSRTALAAAKPAAK